jgi:hypothetical protein
MGCIQKKESIMLSFDQKLLLALAGKLLNNYEMKTYAFLSLVCLAFSASAVNAQGPIPTSQIIGLILQSWIKGDSIKLSSLKESFYT